MLRDYAKENGFPVFDEYIDDGWSGTSFERPGFLRMIADIEAGKINMVITKDLSRLGRDYITAGQYTEIYFPARGVRYIAINDGYDSDSPYTDIAPFKNVINEMYARDISKKIRSAFAAKMRSGAYIAAFAPYGYQKDATDKNRLVVDARSGEVVKRIFRMAADGVLPIEIARTLNAEGTPSPAVYRCMTHDGLDVNQYSQRQEWTGATITKMLRNVVYLGHIAQGKTTKVSFKSQLTVHHPRDEWIVVENTHEALVDEETFALVRRRITARTCRQKGAFANLFAGIAKCADCGRNMSATGTRKKDSPANLVCGGYKLYGADACSNHFIDYNALYAIVLAALRARLSVGREARAAILKEAQRLSVAKPRESGAALDGVKKRLRALERVIGKLYEDNAEGRLSDARTHALLARYEREAEALESRMAAAEKANAAIEPAVRDVRDTLDNRLRRIAEVPELTAKLLYRCIDRIEIEQGHYEKSAQGRVKRQTVRIFFRFRTETDVREYRM